jgi:small subunit ribosomal protein S8e
MGITRDPSTKRRATGGKRAAWRKKRKFSLGRPSAMTKLGPKRIHTVRVRGGNLKFRALRLDSGNFSWGSENCTRKTRILGVVYNASNNEFVRTNTLVKNSIIQVDSTPFRHYYEQHYGVSLVKKKKKEGEEEQKKQSRHVKAVLKHRQASRIMDPKLEEQFSTGRLYAAISSRPGQSGRADGYLLEGPELEFYLRKMSKKKEKKGTA